MVAQIDKECSREAMGSAVSGMAFDMWTKIPKHIYILILPSNPKNYK